MGKGNFLPFEEAIEIARSLGFKTRSEWQNWSRTENRPKDIPSRPHETYKDKGWKDYSDWLGTEIIASYNREYLPFVEAREYVRSLKLSSWGEWSEFRKSEKRPHFIPTSPSRKYKDEWKGMSDWLGTELKGSIPFRKFQESRIFVHELNLRNVKEWNEYAISGKKPLDIPSAPNFIYKNDGWISWGDFLGTYKIGSTARKFLSYEDAKKFVGKLNLRSQTEWFIYAKSESRPKEIPYFASKKYKDQGWVSWNDFLGINTIREKGMEYLPFEEARKFVRSLGLRNRTEYREYCRSGKKPFDIPSTPEIIYKNSGWTYYGDFLGNSSFPRLKKYRSFDKAREFVNSLGLKNQKEWQTYVSSGKKPEDIPCNPRGVYKNDGWIGFGDWLGNGRIANQERVYRSFVCAREFVQGLNLSTFKEWQEYVESGKKPEDIPSDPYKVYKNKGWKGLGDWLGTFQRGETNRWNRSVTLQLLESLPLHSLTSAELLSIIKRSGALDRLNRSENFQRLLEGKTANVKKSIAKKLLDEFRKMSDKEFDDSIDSEPSFTERTIEEGSDDLSDNQTTIDETNWFTDGKKKFREVLDEISELDNEGSVFIDDEVAQFLVNNRVQILWNCHMNGDEAVFGNYESSEGRFMRMVRDEFEKQKRSVENQKRPEGYAFRIDGKIAEPSLMQKLTAHLLSEKKGLINCSGVGAGKSLAAIYASRLLQCRNTLLIAFNSTVDEWKSKIIEYFPDTEVYVKGRYENIVLDRNKWNVVVLNYESFQQHDSSQRLQELVSNNLFDFVILDEVQFAKQSVEGGEEESGISLRRRNIDGTICTIRSSNPELYVLGMSATPVVTNLIEAKKLLEMVKGQEYVDLDTRPSIENALAVHVQLVNNGIRYRPAYDITVRERHLDVDARPLLREIVSVANGRVLSMENVLIDLKLNACREFITKGTMIYSHYTDEGRLLDRIKSFVEENGLSCGIHSGEDKSGKYDFISGRTDVLVGSSSVNTGLDGIQKVCNRIIILSLPWTHSQYEQLKGRIYRQGSSYSDIEVVIPFPEMEIGENRTWSWDRDRYNRVMERKTLADAALDGIIPDDRIRISESTLLSRCQKSLSEWIEEIKRGGQDKGFLRPSIMVALSSEETERVRKRYNPGDFTKFHQNWALEKSSTTHEKFKNDPSLWRYYHDMMDEHSSKWSEQPYRVISSNIRRSEWLIADLGCGQNRLRLELPMNKIEAFDHVAIDDSVIECDISRLPVEDERYDAVVMSLSLMGRNQLDYLKEAYRVLKHKQWLYVAEPKGKWNGNGEELVQILRGVGFGCQGFRMTEDFIYVEGWKN